MIKCEVSVCGTISRSASLRKSKDNEEFIAFVVTVPVVSKTGEKSDMSINVTVDGKKSQLSFYTTGRVVSLNGTMYVRKKDGKTYYNLRSSGEVELVKSTSQQKIEGTMFFSGRIGKKGIDERMDKKGNTYKRFSAFQGEKDGEKIEFTWVNFFYFHPKEGEGFLAPDNKIEVSGDILFNVYKGNVSLDCRVNEVKEYHGEGSNNQ